MTDDTPQRITVDPDTCAVGDTVEVCFDNPSLANQKVTIGINDGTVSGPTDSVSIQLDSTGKGCTTWVAPNWTSGVAIFTHPTSADAGLVITGTS